MPLSRHRWFTVLRHVLPIAGWMAAGCADTLPPSDLPDELPLDEGWSEGQVVPDLLLRDQNGADVRLREFAGDVVLLDLSAVWCAPCREAVDVGEAIAQDCADRSFTFATILLEDASGGRVSPEDAADWAETLGATGPVLADEDRQTASAVHGSFPTFLVLDRSSVIAAVTPDPSLENLASLVASEL